MFLDFNLIKDLLLFVSSSHRQVNFRPQIVVGGDAFPILLILPHLIFIRHTNVPPGDDDFAHNST